MRTTLAKDVKGRARQPSLARGASGQSHHPLHGLHNAIGNGGMQRIGGAVPPAGVNAPQELSRAFMEPRFGRDSSGVRPDTPPGRRLLAHELAHTGAAPPQSSVVVGRANDPLEHAADRAADQVMRGSGLLSTIMPAPTLLRRKCSNCAQEEDAGVVQRKSFGGSDNGAAPASVSATLASPGRPLDRGSLAFFGSRFGRDFSHVRVHDDAQAAGSARDIGANAYTVGSHIAFGAGQYAPASESGGHLLAHELTHVLQASSVDTAIRRQEKPETSAGEADDDSDGIPGPPAPKAEAPKLVDIPLPEPKGESLGDIKGINLVEDSDYMFAQLERLAAKDGTDAPGAFYAALDDEIADDQEALENDPSDVDGVGPTHSDKIDAKKRVLHIVDHVARELEQMADSFVYEFQERARSTALSILQKNKKDALAEAFRYGLASETHSEQMSDCMFGDCTRDVTTYSMRERSPEVTGLQDAAKILLPRRRAFDHAKAELEDVHNQESSCEDGCDDLRVKDVAAQEALEKAATEFQLVMGFLGQKYPILNAFGDADRDADDLEALSKSQDNQSMADTLGKEIFTRLKNIATVTEKIEELNIWQLPILVGLTRAQTDADTDPFFSRVADEVVDYNKPGWLEAIALLVLNIGAIILAGPTGGASLVVAAGVNAVVAIEHTKEYLLKKELAGTAFDRAKGLSADDPSLFWLAVEWIGVGLDVGAAFKAVSSTVKAVETAVEAGDDVAKSKALAELEALGTDAKTKQVVSLAMARLESAAPEEAELAKAVGLTGKEVSSLSEAEGLAAKELEGFTASGKVAGETVASNAKISRLGHIFSCSSPCTWMREKYASILGPELIDTQPNLLREQFLKLETRAADAAEAAELAKKVGKAGEIAKTQKAVEDLEKEIAGFDQTLSKELKYRTGLEHLSAISVENGERLGVMDRELVTRLAELQPAQANRMLKLAPDALEKFGKLAAEDFGKVAKLGERDLGKLAALEPDALAKIAQLEPGNLRYVANLNPEAIDWLSKLSPKQLEKIAGAQVSSPYSLRKMAENIRPKSTMSQINKQLAKAERHKAQLEKAFDAIESGDWSKIPDKQSVGRHLGYEIEERAKTIAPLVGVDKTLHYAALNRKMLKELSEGGERVLVTQGRLQGGALRFDMAVIDFDKKTVELIDLVATANKSHVEKTAAYIEELKKILPPGYELTSTEMRYVDAEGRVVDTLEEAAVAE